jgi:hypothetical protein
MHTYVFISSVTSHLCLLLLDVAPLPPCLSPHLYPFVLAIAWVRHSDRRLFFKFPEVVFMDFTANTTKVPSTVAFIPASHRNLACTTYFVHISATYIIQFRRKNDRCTNLCLKLILVTFALSLSIARYLLNVIASNISSW